MNFSHPILYFYLGASLFYVVDVFQKITSTQINTFRYLMRRSVYTALVSLIGTILLLGISSVPTGTIVLQIVGCSILTFGGLFFYIKAINHLQFSNANSIYVVGNVVQQLFGIIFLKEIFHSWMLISWLLMAFGCVYQISFTKWNKGAAYVLLSTLFWTAGYDLLSMILKSGYEMWSVAIMECTILIISSLVFFLGLKKRKQEEPIPTSRSSHLYLMIIAGAVFSASYFNHLSFRYNPLSMISLMQLSLMPISFIINMRIFKEKPSGIEWISLIAGMIGFFIFIIMSK